MLTLLQMPQTHAQAVKTAISTAKQPLAAELQQQATEATIAST